MLVHLVSSMERGGWSVMNLEMEVEEGTAMADGCISLFAIWLWWVVPWFEVTKRIGRRCDVRLL